MATEIQVPIRLKVLQDSISEFQKILNNLQPNTNNWKALNKIINSMSTEAQRLQAQLSTPFSSEKQFTQANKTIDKLEEAAARVSVVMQGLQFSDIKLTPEQINQFSKFEEEINKIRDAYKKLQDETKGKLFSVEKNQSLLGNIGKGTLEKDFEGLESAVENHIKKLDSQIKSRNEKLTELRSDKALGDSASSLITKGMSVESIGEDVFNKYLRRTKDGALTMNFGDKGVSKQALLNAIGEMYHLEPGELQKTIEESLGKSLKSINAEEINNVFKNMNKSGIFSGIIKRGKESAGKIPLQNQGTEEIRAQLEEYRTLAKEMQALSQQANLPGASADTSTRITEITARMRELEVTILNGARTNGTYTSSMQQLTSQFPQLRNILESTNTQFLKMQQVQNTFNSMKNTIANFMGFYQVLNLTKKAIKEAANHIQELDTVMNKISIVTDMDTSDLWGQIDQYSKMAQTYGTTIKGAYEVSQIYYQQGLETADVLTLTNETLKLAKISGLDYASTTDYMTTAIRGFKMEMSDAATVVDVYSALAANTAVSQEELAVAMSKTASSMESVGSTFQETSAMIATMVAVTRESATNIGSAMKSIGSRYGELTKDPSKLVDSEGEAMAFNKVDAALQSVGISMKTAEGQFREFTDVIVELGEKWAELDSVQQRYIATQFAGNRQQSRFLALVSNIDLLKQNISVAESSEDIGNVQALKALDSLESKIEQVRVAYQQFYTTIGIENVWKNFLDGAKSVINTLNGMPKLFGKIPVGAINAIAQAISAIKSIAFRGLAEIARQIGPTLVQSITDQTPAAKTAGVNWFNSLIDGIRGSLSLATGAGKEVGEALNKGLISSSMQKTSTNVINNWKQQLTNSTNAVDRYDIASQMYKTGGLTSEGFWAIVRGGEEANSVMRAFEAQAQLVANNGAKALGQSLSGIGTALNMASLAIDTSTSKGKVFSGALQGISGAATLAGSAIQMMAEKAQTGLVKIPWVAIATGIIAVITGITQIIKANSTEARLEEAIKKAEELSDKAKELKANYTTLDTSIKKYRQLEDARYDSAEATKEYQEAVDKLVSAYPNLIDSYTINGDAVINASEMERTLAKAREASAAATLAAAQAEAESAKKQKDQDAENFRNSNNGFSRSWERGLVDQTVSSQTYNKVKEKLQLIDYYTDQLDAEKVAATTQELNQFLADNGLELKAYIRKILDNINSTARVYAADNTTIEAANKQTVASYTNQRYSSPEKYNLFKDNNEILNYASQALYSAMEEAEIEDFTDEKLIQYGDKLFNGFDKWWGTLNSYTQNQFNEFIKTPEKYTAKDLVNKGKELGIDLEQKASWLVDIFKNNAIDNTNSIVEQISSKFVNKKVKNSTAEQKLLTRLKAENDNIQALTAGMSGIELNFANALVNKAASMEDEGIDATSFVENALSIYGRLTVMPAQLRNNLIKQFVDNGFTKEGLEKTEKYIESTEGMEEAFGKQGADSLDTLIKNALSNTIATVQAITEGFKGNWEDIDKLISKMSSGFDMSQLDSIVAEAEQYGIKNINFISKNGKQAVLDEDLSQIYSQIKQHYLEGTNELLTNLTDQLDTALKVNFTKGRAITNAEGVNEDWYNIFHNVLQGRFEEFFELNDKNQWVLRANKSQEQLQQALKDQAALAENGIKDLQKLLDSWARQMTLTSQWSNGDYSIFSTEKSMYKDADAAYQRIRELAQGGIKTKKEINDEDLNKAVDTYIKGWSDLSEDLNTRGLDFVKQNLKNYKGIDFSKESILDESGNIIVSLIELARIAAQNAGKTVAEVNQEVAKAVQKENKIGEKQAIAELIYGGKFKIEDLISYLSNFSDQTEISQFQNADGSLKGALAEVYALDVSTGEYKVIAEKTLVDVINTWASALGVAITDDGSELYKNMAESWASDAIKEADKIDAGKQMASVISSLSSAKVGTRVDLSKSPELSAKLTELGIDVSKGYYEVLSEYARDSIILQIESTDEEVQATLKPLQNATKQKRSGGAITSNLMKDAIDLDDIRNFWQNTTFGGGVAGAEGWTDAQAKAAAEQIGYIWDENLQQLIAGPSTIDFYDLLIEYYRNQEGTTQEFLNSLYEKRNNLAAKFRKDEKREALSNLLSNYENAADYIDAVDQQFNVKLREVQGLVTEKDGKEIIDLTKLDEVISGYDDLLQEAIKQLADQYISHMQQAGSLVTQGTTSATEITAFKQAYEQLMHTTLSDSDFIYDYVTNTKILNPQKLRSYLEEAAANSELGLSEDEQRDWVDAQIKALAIDNLDFSTMLSGGATSDQKMQLKRSLEIAFQTYKSMTADKATEAATQVMKDLSEGGQVAIDAMKSIGKELSTEEIKSAYRAQVDPLSALADTLSTLEAGSIVASNQIEALRKVGFDVDANGVIQSTGDLVRAYRGIYNQMKQTGEATLSELNKAMGNLLDNRDGEQQAIDALNNATNMTYSQLAEIYTKAGKELTEYNVAQMQQSGILKALGGNKVMITNFERFASEMGWAADSEEYTNALKAYRDGLISYDQKTGSEIKSIFDAVSGAKLGDKINITYLGDSLTELFGNTVENGILTIKNALTLPQLTIEIGQKAVAEGGMLAEELEAFIASIHDNILNGITGAFDYSTNGTNSIASMQAFAQEYNTLTGENKDYSELFGYDTILNTFTLSQNVLKKYIDAQKEQLKSLGLSGEAIDEYIKDQTDTVLRENIELDSFLNANTNKQRNDEANKLIQQIRGLSNYKDLLKGLDIKTVSQYFQQDDWSDYINRDIPLIAKQYDLAILSILESGGQAAVDLLKQIKPDASQEELEAVFNSQINKLNDVMSQVGDLVAGQFVGTEGKLYEILNRAGAVDGNGVVQAGFDMVSVYAAIYAEMSKTAGNTTAGLNDVYAELMTAQDQSNINIIDALKNGNGMSYKAFGELLAQYDIKLKDYMEQSFGIVERDGFGNIRITDWEAFAKSIFKVEDLNAIKNTPEYISAFKAYNDGLIELNKNTEQAITDEIKQIEGAKNGDWLNLSEFYNKYSQTVRDNTTQWQKYLDSSIFGKSLIKDQREVYFNEAKGKYAIANLNNELNKFGANFEDGILKIGDNANLLGIAQTLEQASADAGLKIGEGLEKVKDAVLNILKSYAEAITKGISGGLTNTEMSDLITKAKDFGITDLQFNETAEGFQLAETSAIKLYQVLKSIDSLHAEEAFNALSESLQKTNENFKTTEALMAHITKIRNGTYAADDKISNARKEQYEAELAVAEEILAVRSTTEDDSFNFMDQKIPSGQNNPLNYWKGWQKAFDAINASKKSKRMDYTDFYNLMTEMGNLSAMMGGQGIQIGKDLVVNSQNYTDLITKAAKNLTTTSKDTNLKVNLPAINVDFSSAKNMVKDVEKGIDAMADEQISMLDGLIALLETIVAMEKLNDITAGGEDDTKIDLGDIFPEITWDENGLPTGGIKYAEDYKKIVDEILALAVDNEDLAKGLKNTKLRNGKESFSLEDIFGMSPETLASQGKDFVQAYSALLEGFRQAAISGNYDENDVFASIKRVLAESGINDLTLEGEKSTIFIKSGVITQVRWEDPDVQSVLAELGGDTEEAREKISSAIDSYLNGEGPGELEFEQVLKIMHRIKVDPETDQNYVMVGSHRYNEGDPDWQGALAAQQLLDMGIESGDINIQSDKALVSNYTIGNKSNIKIESKDGKVEFSGIGQYGETITGSNEQEWLDNYITSFRENAEKYGDHEEAKWTDNEILWRTLNIYVNTKSQIIDKNGQNQDLTHDAETRKYLNEAKKNLTDNLSKYMDNEGNVEIPLENGLTWKISGKDIDLKTDGTYDSRKLETLFSETMGINEALKDTISQAITGAFKNLKDSIKDLDSKPLTEIADAISTIANSISDLTKEKGIEEFEKEISKLDTENLIKIGEALSTISTNLSEVASSGNWLLLDAALTILNGLLALLNINVGVFDSLKTKVDALAEDTAFDTIQQKLAAIKDELIEIKNNQDISISITTDGLDQAISQLQQLMKLLAGLAAGNFNLGPDGLPIPPEEQNPTENNPNGNNPTEGTPTQAETADGQKPQMEVEAVATSADMSGVNGQEKIEDTTAGVTEAVDEGAGSKLEVENATAKVNQAVDDGAGSKLQIEGGTVKPDSVEAPETTEGIEVKAKIIYENGEIPKLDVQQATGIITWDNKVSIPTGLQAHGTVVWHNVGLAGGNVGVRHRYYRKAQETSGKRNTISGSSLQVRDTNKNSKVGVGYMNATGNVGLALAKGVQTLMGELGPELVVANGRYSVVGAEGPEMVSLPKDAIVFNHLQTESLLTKGMSKERGKAVTNERNAVAFATGNFEGPAMASASAALAALKQLRAMWESLRSAKVSDLAGAGGGGGGGGGGGKDDSPKIVDPKTWIATVERWYNLTQEIAKLEKEITYQHQIREKIQSDWQKDGKAYYASQKKSLNALEDQIDAQEQLNVSRQEYYNKRIAALKEDKFGQIYTFDEEGQLQFNKNASLTLGNKTYTNAMEWYTDLVGFDNDKGANYTNKEKYDMLVANGFASYMKYDENGQEIKMDEDNNGEITDEERESYYENATKAFKDKLDDFADATQSLWDEIQEGNKTLEELETARNELLKEMRDNQIDLENKVLDAIVEARQREIDELQDTRDALEESVGKYIDGLTDALDKERSMYDTQEDQDELNRKKRRLAILQRSGGSASEIASLQDEINSSEQDLYFEMQQQQIDAIQQASDLEIERLDHQIDVMTETLEYQKEFGLLWGYVYEVLQGSAAEISQFIQTNSSEVWKQSPLSQDSWWNETLFSADQWTQYRDDITVMADETRAQQLARDYAIFDQAMKAEYGDDYDSTGKWKERFKEVYEDAEQGGRSETETRKILQGDIANEAYVRSKQKLAAEHGVSYIGTGEWSYKSIDDNQHYAYHYENKTGQWTYVNRRKENHEWSGQACSKCGHVKPAPANNSGGGGGGGGSSSTSCSNCQIVCGGACTNKCSRECSNGSSNTAGNGCGSNCTSDCKSGCRVNTQGGTKGGKGLNVGAGKASGGFVSHGIYELGERGTETVLTAEQTRVLRNNILSNRPNSLISLLKTYNEGFSRMDSPLTGAVSEDNSTNIDKIEMTMNVQQISNDYDARRAGEEMMNEVMRIARKTSAANSIRR